jgi:predicted small secreted protein
MSLEAGLSKKVQIMKKFILFVFILLLAVISFLQSCITNTNASEDIIHKKYLMTDSFYKSLSFDKIKTEEVTNQLG